MSSSVVTCAGIIRPTRHAIWKNFTRTGYSWKQRVLRREVREEKETKEELQRKKNETENRRSKNFQVHVWGNAVTGALGACGYGFTVLVSKFGKVLGSGVNTDSQIGVYEEPPKSGRLIDYIIQPVYMDLPLLHPDSTRVVQVSCGRAHTMVLTDQEGVFALGNNSYGQRGRSIVSEELYRGNPNINNILLDEKIVKVVCGQDHSLLLTESGKVYSCGLGADGQTGVGHYNCVDSPTVVRGDIEGEKITHISSKADTAIAVSDKGHLFGWGNSEYNQLSAVTDSTQVNTPRHLPFSDVGRIIKATAGGTMCAALNDRGRVYVWGYGILGKGHDVEEIEKPSMISEKLLGKDGHNLKSRVIDIEAGMNFIMAVTNTGELYSWGKNQTGCLGHGDLEDHYYPVKVSIYGEVKQVYCGVDHVVALSRAYQY